jgi:hypothetical protein
VCGCGLSDPIFSITTSTDRRRWPNVDWPGRRRRSMAEFPDERQLVVRARSQLDQWTRSARIEAYAELFEGNDPILSPEEFPIRVFKSLSEIRLLASLFITIS